jgi:hypothetical protein
LPETATYFLLVKSIAKTAAAPADTTLVEDFQQALANSAAQAGATVDLEMVAQGEYDFIVQITIDTGKYAGLHPGDGGPTAQHIVLGLTAALSHNAGVTTETVPVVPIAEPRLIAAMHSCTR